MKRIFQPLSALLGLLLLLVACNKDEDEIYTVIEESTGVIITGATPSITKYAPGETVRIELAFTNPEQVAEILLYQVVAGVAAKSYGCSAGCRYQIHGKQRLG